MVIKIKKNISNQNTFDHDITTNDIDANNINVRGNLNVSGNINIPNIVDTTTNQTIGGVKTFTDNLNIDNDLTVTGTINNSKMVNTTDAQTIGGIKTFTDNTIFNNTITTINGNVNISNNDSILTLSGVNSSLIDMNHGTNIYSSTNGNMEIRDNITPFVKFNKTAQSVSIGANAAILNNVILNIDGNGTKCISLPIMTDAQRNAIGTPIDSMFIFNSTSDSLQFRANGLWWQVTAFNGGNSLMSFDTDHIISASHEHHDDGFKIINNIDNSKKVRFDTSSITTANERILSFPDVNGVITLSDAIQTLTNKTISGLNNTITNIQDSSLSSNIMLLNNNQNVTGVKSFNNINVNDITSSNTNILIQTPGNSGYIHNKSSICLESGKRLRYLCTGVSPEEYNIYVLNGNDASGLDAIGNNVTRFFPYRVQLSADNLDQRYLQFGHENSGFIEKLAINSFNGNMISQGNIFLMSGQDYYINNIPLNNVSQTLTNKTIDFSNNTVSNIPDNALSSKVIIDDASQTISNKNLIDVNNKFTGSIDNTKQFHFDCSNLAQNSNTKFFLPGTSQQFLVGTASQQTLVNKRLVSPEILDIKSETDQFNIKNSLTTSNLFEVRNNFVNIPSGSEYKINNVTINEITETLKNKTFVVDKAENTAIKIDNTSPDFAWTQLHSNIYFNSGGPTAPNYTLFDTVIKGYQYSANDECSIEFNLPHDFVKNQSALYLHMHLSHNVVTYTGNIDIDLNYRLMTPTFTQAKAQSITVSGLSGLTQYFEDSESFKIADLNGSGNFLDISKMDINDLIIVQLKIISVGTTSPFIFHIDLEHLTTNIMGTKNKDSPFHT
jgi:hypothetical protein